MKTARLSLIALALTTASAGMAFAADASAPKTRDQVRAELMEAQRNGTLIADGQTGATFRDLNPGRYSAQTVAAQPVQPRMSMSTQVGQLQGDTTLQLR